MAFEDARVLAPTINPGDAQQLATLLGQVAGFIDNPIADVRFTPATATASPRTVTVQVRDRVDEPWKGRWLVLLVVGATAWGGPGGAQTLAVTTGTLIFEAVADQVLLVQTDADGAIAFTITDGAANHHVAAFVAGRMQTSGNVATT